MSTGINQHIRVISINNSTTALLDVDSVFTGASDDVSNYDAISVAIKADLDSAIDGVEFQFSDDDETWFTTRYMTYDKDVIFFRTISVKKRYFRIRYTNIDETQTKFRIQTVLLKDKDDTDDTCFMLNSQHIDSLGNIKTGNDKWDVLCDVKHMSTQDTINTTTYTSGSASSSHSSINGLLKLTVSHSDDIAINQTKSYYPLINGKKLRVYITCILNAHIGGNKIGSHSRIGFFDDKNGIYLEYNGDDIALVLRRIDGSLSVTSKVMGRYSWNIDPLDGEGVSDIVVDPSMLTTYFFELSSFNKCGIKFGAVVDGKMHYAHYVNLSDSTISNLQTTNLPIRCEMITNKNGDASMGISAITVMGESNYDYRGSYYNVYSSIGSTISQTCDRVVASIRTVMPTAQLSPIILPMKCTIACEDNSRLIKYSIYVYKGVPSSVNLMLTSDGSPSSYTISESGNVSYLLLTSDVVSDVCDVNKVQIGGGFFRDYKEIDLCEIWKRNKLMTLCKNITNGIDYIIITCRTIGSEVAINEVSMEWEEIQ